MADQTMSTRRRDARRVIASFPRYAEAQQAVDTLSDARFDVSRVSIVGEELRYVEQVTGRVGYGRAAASGAVSGALVGAFIGFLFGLFSFFDPLVSALVLAFWGLIAGAVVGALFGLLGHAMSRGRRDFASSGGMQAGRYDVLVDEAAAEEATRLLSRSG